MIICLRIHNLYFLDAYQRSMGILRYISHILEGTGDVTHSSCPFLDAEKGNEYAT